MRHRNVWLSKRVVVERWGMVGRIREAREYVDSMVEDDERVNQRVLPQILTPYPPTCEPTGSGLLTIEGRG